MKKSRKIILIVSASVLGALMLAAIVFFVPIFIAFGKGNKTVDSLEQYLALCETEVYYPAVPEDTFYGYDDVAFRYEKHMWMLSSEQWIRMVMSYDGQAYDEQVKRIYGRYDFIPGATDLTTGGYSPDFSFGGFDFKTESSIVYPKSMLFIGFNRQELKICYLYFSDTELDSTDDFPLFFRQHGFIEE